MPPLSKDPRRDADTGLNPESFSDRLRVALVGRREPVYEPRATVEIGDAELNPHDDYAPFNDHRYPIAYAAREMQTVERFRRAARVVLDATGAGFADLGAVPENQTWIIERVVARVSGPLASAPDALSAGGSQAAPLAGTNIASLGIPPAGVYKITVTTALTGTAEPLTSNARLVVGGIAVDTNIPTISGTAPYTVTFERVTLDGVSNVIVRPVVNAGAGTIYTAEITAQQIGGGIVGGSGVALLYAGSPPPAAGGSFVPNDADLFAAFPLPNGVGQTDGNAYPILPGTPVVLAFSGAGALGVAVVNLMYAIGVWSRSGEYGAYPGD